MFTFFLAEGNIYEKESYAKPKHIYLFEICYETAWGDDIPIREKQRLFENFNFSIFYPTFLY